MEGGALARSQSGKPVKSTRDEESSTMLEAQQSNELQTRPATIRQRPRTALYLQTWGEEHISHQLEH